MKYECDMIKDLLPLYSDGICSEATKHVVEEHLTDCPDCSGLLDKLKDNKIDMEIVHEKETVIDSQARFFKRKSAVAGGIIAAVFAIPILVCLIVDLANGSGLGWFFIVLAAMLIPTSLLVVPLMAPKNKMLLTMGSFTASLVLLLLVCSIYSHGDWFFVAASSCLFGLTVCFMPFIAARRPVRELLGNKKGLAIMAAYTITFAIMMLCIGLHVDTPDYFRTAFGISGPLIAAAWIIFLIIRYVPLHGLARAGIVIGALTVFVCYGERLMSAIIGMPGTSDYVEVTRSTVLVGPGGGISLLVIGLAAAAVLVAIGLILGRKKGKSNE